MREAVLIGCFIGLCILCLDVCYMAGKWQERREYTRSFVREVEAAYQEGHNDGYMMAKKQQLLEGEPFIATQRN